MCEVLYRSDEITFIGYKIVIKFEGKFYSAFTGIRYRRGPVPKLPKFGICEEKIEKFTDNGTIMNTLGIVSGGCHSELMAENNLTAVYKTYREANEEIRQYQGKKRMYFRKKDDIDFVILEIELDGDLYEGRYNNNIRVMLGNNIVNYKEIKLK